MAYELGQMPDLSAKNTSDVENQISAINDPNAMSERELRSAQVGQLNQEIGAKNAFKTWMSQNMNANQETVMRAGLQFGVVQPEQYAEYQNQQATLQRQVQQQHLANLNMENDNWSSQLRDNHGNPARLQYTMAQMKQNSPETYQRLIGSPEAEQALLADSAMTFDAQWIANGEKEAASSLNPIIRTNPRTGQQHTFVPPKAQQITVNTVSRDAGAKIAADKAALGKISNTVSGLLSNPQFQNDKKSLTLIDQARRDKRMIDDYDRINSIPPAKRTEQDNADWSRLQGLGFSRIAAAADLARAITQARSAASTIHEFAYPEGLPGQIDKLEAYIKGQPGQVWSQSIGNLIDRMDDAFTQSISKTIDTHKDNAHMLPDLYGDTDVNMGAVDTAFEHIRSHVLTSRGNKKPESSDRDATQSQPTQSKLGLLNYASGINKK